VGYMNLNITGGFMRLVLWSAFLFLLSAQNSSGQTTTGPYDLDQVITATGSGNPAIGPVTASQPNELAFLFTSGDYKIWCRDPGSYLSAMSTPWIWGGTSSDDNSAFPANPNAPFAIGGLGPRARPTYPFWALASNAVSASGTTVQESCLAPTVWDAVLALFKYVGNQLPTTPVT